MRKGLLLLLVVSLFVAVEPVFAKRSGFSSSRSKSSFSSSKSSWSKPKPVTTPKTTSSSKSTWSTGNKATNVKPVTTGKSTTTQKSSVYTNPTKKGQTFQSKSEATTAFKKNNATKYSSKYATEPTTRPTHIPQTYSTGGVSYNINYNAGYGGYGYFDALGTWIMYDMMMDTMMMNRMMVADGYHVANAGAPGYRDVPVRRSSGWVAFFIVIFIVAFAIVTASILRD